MTANQKTFLIACVGAVCLTGSVVLITSICKAVPAVVRAIKE